MNGTTRRGLSARFVGHCGTLILALALLTGCESTPNDADAPLLAMAVPVERTVPYGPVNTDNPYEHIGLRHNEAVHAVILAAQPWDTLSIPTMNARIQKAIPEWAERAMKVPYECARAHVKTAFAMKIDTSARRLLATFDAPGYTTRERDYLRRIGTLLRDAASFAELESGLLHIERDILAEAWPTDAGTEAAARIAISIAKHSLAYWKMVFATAAGVRPSDLAKQASIHGTNEELIKIITKCEFVVAADALAGISAAETVAVLGPLVQLEAAVISGGAVSIIVATFVFHEEIVGFLRSLCPWR
ncbi:MAG: hypothetical protein RBU27_10730 [Bacteroidota bacterium]|nr:hypothetical protein [Bacteroidota bacterium]